MTFNIAESTNSRPTPLPPLSTNSPMFPDDERLDPLRMCIAVGSLSVPANLSPTGVKNHSDLVRILAVCLSCTLNPSQYFPLLKSHWSMKLNFGFAWIFTLITTKCKNSSRQGKFIIHGSFINNDNSYMPIIIISNTIHRFHREKKYGYKTD